MNYRDEWESTTSEVASVFISFVLPSVNMTAIESSSFVQVLQSLETLNSVMEGVFQRLTERVTEVVTNSISRLLVGKR